MRGSSADTRSHAMQRYVPRANDRTLAASSERIQGALPPGRSPWRQGRLLFARIHVRSSIQGSVRHGIASLVATELCFTRARSGALTVRRRGSRVEDWAMPCQAEVRYETAENTSPRDSRNALHNLSLYLKSIVTRIACRETMCSMPVSWPVKAKPALQHRRAVTRLGRQ